jgi:hypothetical protein
LLRQNALVHLAGISVDRHDPLLTSIRPGLPENSVLGDGLFDDTDDTE